MHFDFTITAGQVVLFSGILGLIWRIEVFSTWLLLEHEMLMEWYCISHNIKPSELMTRKMKFGLFGMLKKR